MVPANRYRRDAVTIIDTSMFRVRTGADKQGLRVKMCVWLGVSRGLDLAFLNAD